MRKFILAVKIVFLSIISNAQLTVNSSYTAQQLVQNHLIGGGVMVSNISYTGFLTSSGSSCNQIAYFSNGNSTSLGMNTGILLTTGCVNNVSQSGSAFMNDVLGGSAIPELSSIVGSNTFDGAVLEFDFVPYGDSIKLNYIFGSEEYPEFVNSGYNDVFAFLISGPNPLGGSYTNQNIALVPGTTTPVSIDNVNSGLNQMYYINNDESSNQPVFDGFTTPLEAIVSVVPNQIYHLKICIADVGDASYDSGLFLNEQSLQSPISNYNNTNCIQSMPLCFGSTDTMSLNTNLQAESGPNYGCLYTQPNPSWFNIQVSQPGDLLFNLSSLNDIDFACWGPFTNPYSVCTSQLTAICTNCPGNSSNPSFYPSGNLVDCSYSPSSQEYLHINNAQTGQYYVFMVTNYSNQPSNLVINQTNVNQPGTGSISCLTPTTCNIDSIIVSIGNCDSLNQYLLQGQIFVSNNSSTGFVRITDIASGAEFITASGGNHQIPFSFYVPFASGSPELNIEFNDIICSETVSYTRPKTPSITTNLNNSSCGQSNGYIVAGVTGNGIPPYSYVWSTGQSTLNTNSTATYLQNIPVGHYALNAYNSNHCYSHYEYNIVNAGAPNITLNQTGQNICSTLCNASLQAIITGGQLPYTYSWSNGSLSVDSSGIGTTVSQLCNGTYYLTVSDNNHCASVSEYTIQTQNPLQVEISEIQYPSCTNNGLGSIQILASGGTSPYSYIWSTLPVQTISTANHLAPGNYTYTVTDANGCSISNTISLPYQTTLHIEALITEPQCGNDGIISINAIGGQGPYSYTWQNNPSNHTNILSGINSGTYNVTVTDYNACSVTGSFTLNHHVEPMSSNITSFSSIICVWQNNGYAIIQLNGGNPPYYDGIHYFSSIDTLHNLSAGSQNILFTDSVGCISNIQFTIQEGNPPIINAYVTNATCGNSDGSIIIQMTSGTPPYSYYWSNGSSTVNVNNSINTLSNLTGGIYSLTITQSSGCDLDTLFVVNNLSSMTLVADTIIPPSCSLYSDGSAIVHAQNGTPPYTYLWPGGCTSNQCNNLGAGTYIVTVNDASNCEVFFSITVPQGQTPVANFTYSAQMNTYSFTNISTPGNYIWMFGDGNTSSLTNPVHTYLNNGLYTVCLSVYSCDTITNCLSINVVGAGSDNLNAHNLMVIPNPANEFITIKSDLSTPINIEIFNSLGQKIMDKQIISNEIIKIDQWAEGIYFIKTMTEGKSGNYKFVIER